MLFTRATSYLIGFFALSAAAMASPVAEEKRAAPSVQSVLTTLQSKVNSIAPQIRTSLATNGEFTYQRSLLTSRFLPNRIVDQREHGHPGQRYTAHQRVDQCRHCRATADPE